MGLGAALGLKKTIRPSLVEIAARHSGSDKFTYAAIYDGYFGPVRDAAFNLLENRRWQI